MRSPLYAMQTLSPLSYGPVSVFIISPEEGFAIFFFVTFFVFFPSQPANLLKPFLCLVQKASCDYNTLSSSLKNITFISLIKL